MNRLPLPIKVVGALVVLILGGGLFWFIAGMPEIEIESVVNVLSFIVGNL